MSTDLSHGNRISKRAKDPPRPRDDDFWPCLEDEWLSLFDEIELDYPFESLFE
jgi:hypothetical protein